MFNLSLILVLILKRFVNTGPELYSHVNACIVNVHQHFSISYGVLSRHVGFVPTHCCFFCQCITKDDSSTDRKQRFWSDSNLFMINQRSNTRDVFLIFGNPFNNNGQFVYLPTCVALGHAIDEQFTIILFNHPKIMVILSKYNRTHLVHTIKLDPQN